MAQVPANQKLWSMIVAQARTKFAVYPSLAASRWIHQEYVHKGGMFVGSEKDVDPRFKDKKKDEKN